MRTQALIGCAVLACASGMSRRPSPPTAMTKLNAPLVFRNSRRSMSGLLRRALNRGDDAVIRAAAADVAVHVRDDLLARGLGIRREQLRRLHDLARLAVTALRHLLGDPGLLQRMRGVGREALDRRHLRAFHGSELRGAGAHRLAVDMHRARAAECRAAAELGTGELELIADHPQQRRAVLRLRGDRLAVEIECDHRHLLCALIFLRRDARFNPVAQNPQCSTRAANYAPSLAARSRKSVVTMA